MIGLITDEQKIECNIETIRSSYWFYHDFACWEKIFELLNKNKEKLKSIVALEYARFIKQNFKQIILENIQSNHEKEFFQIFSEIIEELFDDPTEH